MARRAIGGGGPRKKKTPVRRMTVRKGDKVRVIRGAFAGKEGTVLRAIPKENRVVIEGVNLRKRHMRPSASNPDGGIVTFALAFWLIPNELEEVISCSDGICPKLRSSGAVTSEAMTEGLAPGSWVVTWMVGKSTCGSEETGSQR